MSPRGVRVGPKSVVMRQRACASWSTPVFLRSVIVALVNLLNLILGVDRQAQVVHPAR